MTSILATTKEVFLAI